MTWASAGAGRGAARSCSKWSKRSFNADTCRVKKKGYGNDSRENGPFGCKVPEFILRYVTPGNSRSMEPFSYYLNGPMMKRAGSDIRPKLLLKEDLSRSFQSFYRCSLRVVESSRFWSAAKWPVFARIVATPHTLRSRRQFAPEPLLEPRLSTRSITKYIHCLPHTSIFYRKPIGSQNEHGH